MIRVFFSWLCFIIFVLIVYMFTERVDWIKKYIIEGQYPFGETKSE